MDNDEGAWTWKRVPIDPVSDSEDITLEVPVGWNKPTSQGNVGSLRGCKNLGVGSAEAGISAVAKLW